MSDKCPKCGNFLQNGTVAYSENLTRCASCKHVWEPEPHRQLAAKDVRIAELERADWACGTFHECNGTIKPYRTLFCSSCMGRSEDFDAVKRITTLVELLRKYQWEQSYDMNDMGSPMKVCRECSEPKREGCSPDCRLAAAIKEK